jgi:hypothetical protein
MLQSEFKHSASLLLFTRGIKQPDVIDVIRSGRSKMDQAEINSIIERLNAVGVGKKEHPAHEEGGGGSGRGL